MEIGVYGTEKETGSRFNGLSLRRDSICFSRNSSNFNICLQEVSCYVIPDGEFQGEFLSRQGELSFISTILQSYFLISRQKQSSFTCLPFESLSIWMGVTSQNTWLGAKLLLWKTHHYPRLECKIFSIMSNRIAARLHYISAMLKLRCNKPTMRMNMILMCNTIASSTFQYFQ